MSQKQTNHIHNLSRHLRNNDRQMERQIAKLNFTKCDNSPHIAAIDHFTGYMLLNGHTDKNTMSSARSITPDIKNATLIVCGTCSLCGDTLHKLKEKWCGAICVNCGEINHRYIRNEKLSVTPVGKFIGYSNAAVCIEKDNNIIIYSLETISITKSIKITPKCNFKTKTRPLHHTKISSDLTKSVEVCSDCATIIASHNKIRVLYFWLAKQIIILPEIAALICK